MYLAHRHCLPLVIPRTYTHTANLNKDPDLISIAPLLPHSLDNLSLSLLPVYKEATVSALVDISSDGDGSQPAGSMESSVHKDVPFVDLKVLTVANTCNSGLVFTLWLAKIHRFCSRE